MRLFPRIRSIQSGFRDGFTGWIEIGGWRLISGHSRLIFYPNVNKKCVCRFLIDQVPCRWLWLPIYIYKFVSFFIQSFFTIYLGKNHLNSFHFFTAASTRIENCLCFQSFVILDRKDTIETSWITKRYDRNIINY